MVMILELCSFNNISLLMMWCQEKLKEDQKDSFTLDARNDLLAQALGKLPRTGHMQGLDKFISASNYFHTIRGPIRSERKRELDAWKKLVDAQLQEICRELKRTPRHSNVGSSTFPHNKDIDNDSKEDVHQVASFIKLTEFFLVYFSLYIFHSIQFNLLFANNADRN